MVVFLKGHIYDQVRVEIKGFIYPSNEQIFMKGYLRITSRGGNIVRRSGINRFI